MRTQVAKMQWAGLDSFVLKVEENFGRADLSVRVERISIYYIYTPYVDIDNSVKVEVISGGR